MRTRVWLRLFLFAGTLDASHQHKDEYDDQYDTQYAGGEVAEAARIAPIGQGADQQQNEDDDEDLPPKLVT